MNFSIIFSVITLLSVEFAVANKDEIEDHSLIKDEIYKSFKSMYSHLAYVTYYISERARTISDDKASIFKYSKHITESSLGISTLLGFDVSTYIPYKTTSLGLDSYLKKDSNDFKDLKKVEEDVKSGLDVIPQLFSHWNKYFRAEQKFSKDENIEKNANVHRLIFCDFLAIFFPLAKKMFETYGIKSKKVNEYELYSKQLYLDGIIGYSGREVYSGFYSEPAIISMVTRVYRGDSDLLDRMFSDIESQVRPLIPEIETFIKLYRYYKSTLDLL